MDTPPLSLDMIFSIQYVDYRSVCCFTYESILSITGQNHNLKLTKNYAQLSEYLTSNTSKLLMTPYQNREINISE